MASVHFHDNAWPIQEGQAIKDIPSDTRLSWKGLISKKIKEIPLKGATLIKDNFYLTVVLHIVNLFAQISSLLNREAYPVISLIFFPICLFQAGKHARKHSKLFIQALRVKQFTNAFLFACQGIDSFGNILEILAKGANGTLEIAPIKHLIHSVFHQSFCSSANFLKGFGITVNFVIPIILIVTGAIGTIANAFILKKNVEAYQKLNQVNDNLSDICDYFSKIQQVDKDSEISKWQNVAKEIFETTHAINESHFDLMKEKMNVILNENAQLEADWQEFKFDPQIQNLQSERMIQIFEAIQNITEITNIKNSDFANQIYELKNAFNQLKEIAEENNEAFPTEFFEQIDSQIIFLDSLEQRLVSNFNDASLLMAEMKAEMHRNILLSNLNLMLSLVTLVTGILSLTHPHWTLTAVIIGATTSSVEIVKLIMNQTISRENWYKIELKLLGPELLQKPQSIPDNEDAKLPDSM